MLTKIKLKNRIIVSDKFSQDRLCVNLLLISLLILPLFNGAI